MRGSLARYLHYLSAECGLSLHTIAAYRLDVERFTAYLDAEEGKSIDAVRPDQVEPDHVRAFLWLEEKRGLQVASLARALVAIKGLFRFLVADGELAQNRMDEIDAPSTSRRIPTVLGTVEVQRLMDEPWPDNALGLRDRAVLELLYATGARVSEVTRIDATSLRLDMGFLRVMGKGRKERIVPLGGRACEACAEYLRAGRPRLLARARREVDALLVSSRGLRLSRNAIWRLVKTRCRALGLRKSVSPHTLRHSFATHLLQNGAGIRTVQEMLGHASVSSTQLYTHVDRTHLRAVHQRFHPRA